MIFFRPIPYREALDSVQARSLLPTGMSSAQLEALAPEIRERALFSARTTQMRYLQEIQDQVQELVDGRTDQATAELRLKETLDSIGYEPAPDEAGTIKDLSSDGRIKLVTDMQADFARGYGAYTQAQDPAVVDQWPAWELYRLEQRREPRDWPTRWQRGAQISGDGSAGRAYANHRRMVARKDSGIWNAISRFGTPYPPFDYNSGMWTRQINRQTAEMLGVVQEGTEVQPQTRRINEDLELPMPARDAQLRSALMTTLGEQVEFDGETLRWKGRDDGGDRIQSRPGDRPMDRPAVEPAGGEPVQRRVYRDLRSADFGTALPDPVARVARAEIASVVAGRKPLHHEHWGPQADQFAEQIRRAVPSDVSVDVREGHLYVYRPDSISSIIDADPEAYPGDSILDRIHQATRSGTNGELLGFSSRRLNEPGSVRVGIRDSDGELVTGFHARPAMAQILAEAKVADLEAATGDTYQFVIRR